MSEWWTYTLSDFLLFSPRTYYRMIQHYNEALWPAHLVALGLAAAVAWLLLRPRQWHARPVFAVLALFWAWVAWAFLWERYAAINWAAVWFAAAFALEALVLLWIGVVRRRVSFAPRRDAGRAIGLGLFVAAVTLYPLLAPALGRGWRQAEVFGLMPEPTAIGTIGLVLAAQGGPRRWALIVPAVWCVIAGATLWAMRSAGG